MFIPVDKTEESVYPIDAKYALSPSHNCGLKPYQPQQMNANDMAAFRSQLFLTSCMNLIVLSFILIILTLVTAVAVQSMKMRFTR